MFYLNRMIGTGGSDWADNLDLSLLSSLVERGVSANVLSKSEDILQSSVDYYEFPGDVLCWDWADDSQWTRVFFLDLYELS